jgi:hypothetical protein
MLEGSEAIEMVEKARCQKKALRSPGDLEALQVLETKQMCFIHASIGLSKSRS